MVTVPVLLVARLLLAGVFALAGAAKLLDRSGSRRSLADFGVPAALTAPLSIALPLAEVAVALSLLTRSFAAYGAVGAFVLLLLFVGGIAFNLARGRSPDCHCFGQLYSKPIGWPALCRNAALAAVALFVATAGWSSAGPSLAAGVIELAEAVRTTAAGAAVLVTVLGALTAFLARLIQQNARLRQQVTAAVQPDGSAATAAEDGRALAYAPSTSAAGSRIGARAPSFSLPRLDGGTASLDELRAPGRPVLLFFTDPDCGPCRMLSPEIARWQEQHASTVTVAVISRGAKPENNDKLGLLQVKNVLLQRNREVALAYGAFGTPAAMMVRADGTVGSALTVGDSDIRKLVQRTSEEPISPPVRTPSPVRPDGAHEQRDLDGPHDLDGRPVSLEQFIDRQTLLLFWNPGCIFCQRMLADLKDWEAKPLTDRAQLLVVSSGSLEQNRAFGLSSTIVIDNAFAYGRQYGALGTPAAVLVDAQGHPTSDAVVSAPAIFTLIGHDVTPRDAAEEEAAIIAAPTLEPLMMTLPEGARPLKDGCVHDELLSDGSMILYNGCRHQVLTINPTAALVWEYCDGEFDIPTIVSELRGMFPESAAIEADVQHVLDNLVQAGMIGPAPSPLNAGSSTVAAI